MELAWKGPLRADPAPIFLASGENRFYPPVCEHHIPIIIRGPLSYKSAKDDEIAQTLPMAQKNEPEDA